MAENMVLVNIFMFQLFYTLGCAKYNFYFPRAQMKSYCKVLFYILAENLVTSHTCYNGISFLAVGRDIRSLVSASVNMGRRDMFSFLSCSLVPAPFKLASAQMYLFLLGLQTTISSIF